LADDRDDDSLGTLRYRVKKVEELASNNAKDIAEMNKALATKADLKLVSDKIDTNRELIEKREEKSGDFFKNTLLAPLLVGLIVALVGAFANAEVAQTIAKQTAAATAQQLYAPQAAK
jgi:hypothetical protein